MKIMIGSLIVSLTVAFLMWGPLRWFLYSFIPVSAEWGWIIKFLLLLLIGYFGGIVLPIGIAAFGVFAYLKGH